MARDLDGNGDLDVVLMSPFDGLIAWYENVDGRGKFGVQPTIIPMGVHDSAISGGTSIVAADLDSDADADVLSASGANNSRIVWCESTDGMGTFSEQKVVTTTTWASSVYAADLDGDGDTGVLSTSSHDKIAWYENLGLPAQPGDVNEDWQFDQTDITAVLEAGKYQTGAPAGWSEGD